MEYIRSLLQDHYDNLKKLKETAIESGYSDNAICEIDAKLDQIYQFLRGDFIPAGPMSDYLRKRYSETDDKATRDIIEKIYCAAKELAVGQEPVE
jgi:hypothetical protein